MPRPLGEQPNPYAPEGIKRVGRLDPPAFHRIAELTGGISAISESNLTVRFAGHGDLSLHRSLISGTTLRAPGMDDQRVDAVALHEAGPKSASSVTIAWLNEDAAGNKVLTKTTLTKGRPLSVIEEFDVTIPDGLAEEDIKILAEIQAGKQKK